MRGSASEPSLHASKNKSLFLIYQISLNGWASASDAHSTSKNKSEFFVLNKPPKVIAFSDYLILGIFESFFRNSLGPLGLFAVPACLAAPGCSRPKGRGYKGI